MFSKEKMLTSAAVPLKASRKATLPNGRCRRRLRVQLCHQFFDVALTHVRGRVEHRAMVVRRQVGRQQRHGGEGDRAAREPVEDQREPARRSSGFYAPVRGVFREVQDARAVGEQRRAALAQIEASSIELGQRGDELRGGMALGASQVRDLCQQFVVRDIGTADGRRHVSVRLHIACISRDIRAVGARCSHAISRPFPPATDRAFDRRADANRVPGAAVRRHVPDLRRGWSEKLSSLFFSVLRGQRGVVSSLVACAVSRKFS